MSDRLQVVVSPEERESFRRQAKREGLSVSAWLRRLGRAQVEEHDRPGLRTAEDLRAFFHSIRERRTGREPDWEEHKAAIEKSRVEGLPQPPP